MSATRTMPRRMKLLAAVLALLAVLLGARGAFSWLPREPRLGITNGYQDVAKLTVSDGTRRISLGRFPEGATVVAPVRLRRGGRYTVLGRPLPPDEVERLIPIARGERRDLVVRIDFHGCLVLEGHELNALTVPGYGGHAADE